MFCSTIQTPKGRRGLSFALSLLIVCLLLLTACTHSTEDRAAISNSSPTEEAAALPSSRDAQQGRLKIVASIFAPYDFARTIAGEAAEVSMLVPAGAETHSFEPTPADIKLLNEADVFIYVGGESDAWLEKILASLENPDLTLIRLTDIIDTLEEVALPGMDIRSHNGAHEHEEASEEVVHEHAGTNEHEMHEHEGESESEHEEGEADEHVWTSVRNAQLIVSSLCDSFSKLDPAHADLFAVQAQGLNAELKTLDERFASIVEMSEHSTLVFGDRFPFRYFAEDYGLTCFAAYPGCSTAVDTNPATIIFLIDTVRSENIPVVWYIELSDKRIARTVSEATGAQALEFHSVHNISKDDFDTGATYVSLMNANADNLEVALSDG